MTASWVRVATGALILLAASASARAAPATVLPIVVVAAENVYGDAAARIGGDRVAVSSILYSPAQDPHLFEATTGVARKLADARLVICNGAGYDPWIDSLLAAAPRPARQVIVVADLLHTPAGANPHLWYDPAALPLVAAALAQDFTRIDPDHQVEYQRRLASFLLSLEPVRAQIQSLRQRYAGTVVTATEPIFGYMADALGFEMRDLGFQRAVMNDTEPSASDVARIEGEIERRQVKILFHNTQTQAPMTERLLAIARRAQVPIVGVSEMEPADTPYERWMTDTLDAVAKALAGHAP